MKKKELIVALDVAGKAARLLVRQLGSVVDFYKVPPSATLEDAGLIPWLRARKKKIFLDCKWLDIPSQVQRSVEAAGRRGVTAVTIHTGAGRAVMIAAVRARPKPLVWGVTVLTSLGAEDLREVGVRATPLAQVLRLARLAQSVGLDGLVCSPREVATLRRAGIRLPLITPGIQFGGHVGGDQKRTATPQDAWGAGATHLVVGRSILEASDPARTAREILKWRGKGHAS
ncbi:MAG: orotidine-5'-phosphate decarboxylase [Elusimicrobia bacterium]|jgi:orotidine-5'-phosphate decarboxylase|nr:orotidine-5'-phosphate decarboxylase [Elusimicrobiota bacterium]